MSKKTTLLSVKSRLLKHLVKMRAMNEGRTAAKPFYCYTKSTPFMQIETSQQTKFPSQQPTDFHKTV